MLGVLHRWASLEQKAVAWGVSTAGKTTTDEREYGRR